MTDAIEVVEEVFRLHGEGRVIKPPRQCVDVPGGTLRITTAVVPPMGRIYSTASHRRYALKCGATEAELQAVDSMAVGAMAEREAAALRLAEAMNESGLKVTEDIFKNVQSDFSPAEIIELLATVGLMVFASRLADALGLQPDP